MYTASNYFWGLVAYYLGALVVTWYIYWLLSKIPNRHVCNSLSLLFVAILFTPVQAYQGAELMHLAPAYLVYLFEGLVFTSAESPERALTPIVFVYLVLMGLYVGWQWWSAHRRRQNPISQTEQGESAESEDDLGKIKNTRQSPDSRTEPQIGDGSA